MGRLFGTNPFFPVYPGAFVEQLAFAEAIFFLDSGLCDGCIDADVTADGGDVGLHLAACGFGGLVEQLNSEIPDNLLAYLKKKDINRYRAIVEKLGLRK